MKRIIAFVMLVGGCTQTENLNMIGTGIKGTFNLMNSGVAGLIKWITTGTLMLFLVSGCAENQSETRMTITTLKEMAETGNVQGKLRVKLTGMGEAGMKNGVYFGTEGSYVEGELEYRFAEKPTTQPVE